MITDKTFERVYYNSRSLIFWMRDLRIALNQCDTEEINKAREAIEYNLELFDECKLTYRTQNNLLAAGRGSSNKYINDYIREITFYFKDEDDTIISGEDLVKNHYN